MIEFDSTKGKLTISPFLYEIKQFKTVLQRKDAKQVLTFIWHMETPVSPYAKYNEQKRFVKLIDDIEFSDSKSVVTISQQVRSTGELDDDGDDIVETFDRYDYHEDLIPAVAKYREFSETATTKAIKSAYSALDRIDEFFSEVDFNERTKSGSAVYKPKEVLSSIGGISDAHDHLVKLDKAIREELSEKDNVRGGVKLNPFNTV